MSKGVVVVPSSLVTAHVQVVVVAAAIREPVEVESRCGAVV
jgi:hypothetical protein